MLGRRSSDDANANADADQLPNDVMGLFEEFYQQPRQLLKKEVLSTMPFCGSFLVEEELANNINRAVSTSIDRRLFSFVFLTSMLRGVFSWGYNTGAMG